MKVFKKPFFYVSLLLLMVLLALLSTFFDKKTEYETFIDGNRVIYENYIADEIPNAVKLDPEIRITGEKAWRIATTCLTVTSLRDMAGDVPSVMYSEEIGKWYIAFSAKDNTQDSYRLTVDGKTGAYEMTWRWRY